MVPLRPAWTQLGPRWESIYFCRVNNETPLTIVTGAYMVLSPQQYVDNMAAHPYLFHRHNRIWSKLIAWATGEYCGERAKQPAKIKCPLQARLGPSTAQVGGQYIFAGEQQNPMTTVTGTCRVLSPQQYVDNMAAHLYLFHRHSRLWP